MTGLLIAMEGIDGSGKGTQAAVLEQRLKGAGVRTRLLSFPRYQETSFGRQIGRFLNGQFGDLGQVHPLLASLLFAGDRFESRQTLLEAISGHDVVICDRYVASNVAHQAAKRWGTERKELIAFIEGLEFGIYQLPSPQLIVWLDVPVAQAQELIAGKARRAYTEKAADLHEADAAYLEQVAGVYAALAREQPHWRRIDCLAEGKLRTVEDIAAEVYDAVSSMLPLEKRQLISESQRKT